MDKGDFFVITIYIYIYIFITEGFFELAIESWPEWDLNPRPLNSETGVTRKHTKFCEKSTILTP